MESLRRSISYFLKSLFLPFCCRLELIYFIRKILKFRKFQYYRAIIKKASFVWIVTIFFVYPINVWAQSIGEQFTFKLERTYDYEFKAQRQATIVYISANAQYFIANDQNYQLSDVRSLAEEFESVIYPKSIEIFEIPESFKKEALPIKVIFTKMPSDIAGYFNNDDARNEIFLNSNNLKDIKKMRVYLAHEFAHLLTAYLKDKKFGNKDETWLNELRSEYVPAAFGYYNDEQNNLLNARLKQFLNKPYESFYPWKNTPNNYAAVSMFGYYLIDRLGLIILKDMLHSEKTGLKLVDEIAQKRGVENSARLYHDFAITNILNDSKVLNGIYSYKNKKLDFKIAPELKVSNINNFEIVIDSFDYTVIEITPNQKGEILQLNLDENNDKLIYTSLVLFKANSDPTINTKILFKDKKNYFFIPPQNDVSKVYIVFSSAVEDNQAVNINLSFLNNISNLLTIKSLQFPIIKENTQPSFTIYGSNFLEPEIIFSNGQKAHITSNLDDRIIFIFPQLPKGRYNIQIKNLDGQTISLPNALIVIEDLPDGTIIKRVFDQDVLDKNKEGEKFIIKGNLAFPIDSKNKVLYNKKDVVEIFDDAFLYFKVTNLVKVKNDTKIYEIDKLGFRHWLKMTPQQFIASGRSFENVFEISEKELNLYPLAKPILR